MRSTVSPTDGWPVVIHFECGYKALLYEPQNGRGRVDYWRRFSEAPGTYVECGRPL